MAGALVQTMHKLATIQATVDQGEAIKNNSVLQTPPDTRDLSYNSVRWFYKNIVVSEAVQERGEIISPLWKIIKNMKNRKNRTMNISWL